MTMTPDIIRVCRSSLGITQGELAREVGVSSSFLSAIERYERVLTPTLERSILTALGLRHDDATEFSEAFEKLSKRIGGNKCTNLTEGKTFSTN